MSVRVRVCVCVCVCVCVQPFLVLIFFFCLCVLAFHLSSQFAEITGSTLSYSIYQLVFVAG